MKLVRWGAGVEGPSALPRTHRWPVSLAYGPVTLTPFRLRDIPEWQDVRARNSSWLSRWEASSPPGSIRPRSASTLVRSLDRDARAGRSLPWLVRYDPEWSPGDGPATTIAGQCTVANIVYGAARFASIGYWVDERWAGRGITPVAVALATDYAMRVAGLHRIEVCIRPENAASLRVVDKLGFRYEGCRPRYLHIAGDWRDHECFALDASETGPGLVARLAHIAPEISQHVTVVNPPHSLD